MCIICIKKRGVRFPSKQEVKSMCDNNPHGFSMVLSEDGRRPSITKTMDKNQFLTIYSQVLRIYDPNKTSMYIHARISTHGSNRVENCHGWRSDGLVFAHNGILSIANRGDMTDSETYFRDIFIPAYRCGGWKMAEKTVDAIIGTSKFAIMDKNGEIRHYGQYIDDDGLLFSNTTYQERKWVYPTRSYGFTPTKSTSADWDFALHGNDYPF